MASRSVDQLANPLEGPWEDDSKIVIGIDVGTTQSGVTCTFLQEGGKKTIHHIVKWPGQEPKDQQGRIPTLVWYDSDNKAVSFGAEALTPQAEEDAEDQGWILAKYFKLHLHPSDMEPKQELKLYPLPPGVSLRQIYVDFLGYLLQHTKLYFEERILDGKKIWTEYQSKMEVVLAHPNSWGLREQRFLRDVAVEAGFADVENANTNIIFVTEAEASVHYCIHHTNLGERLEAGMNFIVCDAGGSTVDTTMYTVVSARPVLKLDENGVSACVQAGGIFVDEEAEKYLRNIFKKAKLSPDEMNEYTKNGVKDFEGFAKRLFHDATEEQKVMVAGRKMYNEAINTRRGRMTLAGSTMKLLYNKCTTAIVASVDQKVQSLDVSYMLLVGGFGDSPYLRREFKERYEPRGSDVTLTNDSTAKAVADGAVIWRISSSVISRAPRSSFGTLFSPLFIPSSSEHRGRVNVVTADGRKRVIGAWSQIVTKGVSLDVQAIRRKSFNHLYDSAIPDLRQFEVLLLSYSGNGEPGWATSKQGQLLPGFTPVGTIKADLKRLSGALQRFNGLQGAAYWALTFDVCIRFGGTELEAFLEWQENGVTCAGKATILPEDMI